MIKYIFFNLREILSKNELTKLYNLRLFCGYSSKNNRAMEVDNEPNYYIDKNAYTPVSEGLATVNFPSSHDVFYNPVQEFNRDMSTAVLRLHASDYKKVSELKLNQSKKTHAGDIPNFHIKENDFKFISDNVDILPCGEKDENGIKILEALAASGLRSIRYAKEVGGVREIVANDISKQAVECMKSNLESNKVNHIVKTSHNDASLVMYQHRQANSRFTAVDLDPYGSPHTFLDGAVQCVADGGLLLVTCTDMAVLCGNSPETCYIKYGSLSLKHKACHEVALRIILQCIEANANKYGRYIVPLVSMSVDFYARVFVRVFTSQVKCKETFSKLSWIHQCTSCDSTTFQPLGNVVRNGPSVKYQLSIPNAGPKCIHCGGTHRTGGPIWTAPIHDVNFVSRLKSTINKGTPFNTIRRMEGTLALIEEELPDAPLYIVFDKILKVLRMRSFKMKEFISAILNAGYRVSPTHAARNGIKTDAPIDVIWNILRAREKLDPRGRDILPADHPGRVILKYDNSDYSEDSFKDISFEMHPDATFESEKFLRFQVNPTENWGPKARAVTSIFYGDLQEKSKKNQGMRKCKKLKRNNVDDQESLEHESKENDIS